ncbi:hypothetical protein BJ742DRAFT_415512 [Cladochytrium replicatum]|nr:hypothetical protein BJ742DRAFT_415512 [Cladochytrium replicatum]
MNAEVKSSNSPPPTLASASPLQDLPLEPLLHLESMFTHLGYTDGYTDGRLQGLNEGRLVGAQRGFAIAREVAFYAGAADLLLTLDLPPRTKKAAQALAEATKALPEKNGEGAEVVETLERCRVKYKAVGRMLGEGMGVRAAGYVEDGDGPVDRTKEPDLTF